MVQRGLDHLARFSPSTWTLDTKTAEAVHEAHFMLPPATILARQQCTCCDRRHVPYKLVLSAALISVLLFVLLLDSFDVRGEVPRATGEAPPQMEAMESSEQFRVHGVATNPARGEGWIKFVLQQKAGVSSDGGSGSSSSASWRTLSFGEVSGLWRNSSPPFVDVFAASIAALPFDAVFWESAPVTKTTMVRILLFLLFRLEYMRCRASYTVTHKRSCCATSGVLIYHYAAAVHKDSILQLL